MSIFTAHKIDLSTSLLHVIGVIRSHRCVICKYSEQGIIEDRALPLHNIGMTERIVNFSLHQMLIVKNTVMHSYKSLSKIDFGTIH